jgi:hypothetical protein
VAEGASNNDYNILQDCNFSFYFNLFSGVLMEAKKILKLFKSEETLPITPPKT